jgi:hypothetical protein
MLGCETVGNCKTFLLSLIFATVYNRSPLYSPSARRAIAKIAIHGIAALAAPVPASFLEGPLETTLRRGNRPATIADQNGVTFFNTKKRNKKHAQVMINPLQSGLRQATGGANSRSLVQSDSLGLNSTDQEEHFSPAPQRFRLIYSTFFKGLLRLETGN